MYIIAVSKKVVQSNKEVRETMRRILAATLVFLFMLSVPLGATREEEELRSLKTFTNAFTLVEENYVEKVDPKKLIYGAIKGMLQSLDPHSSFLTPDMYKEMEVETKGSFGGIGIEITIKNGWLTVVSPIEGTPAYKAGLKPGDKIIKINGVSTRGISLMEAVKKLRGPKGTKVTITIFREGVGKPFDVTITRDIIRIKSVEAKLLGKDIGYVKLRQFQETTDRELEKVLKKWQGKIKGFILDLRNNPGGLLDQAVKVSDLFIDKGVIVSIKGRKKSSNHVFTATSEAYLKGIPMVVLVNAGSASASEIVASCLQDHRRAVIVGTRTFGKGSVQTIFPMDDGSAIRLTTAKYYSPAGREIQGNGVEPDVVVEEIEVKKKKERAFREEELIKHFKGMPEKERKRKEKKSPLEKMLNKDFQLKVAYSLLEGWIKMKGL